MPRVVSIFFPDLPTDRIRRADPAIPVEEAVAVISRSGSKRWVAAADPAARKAGVHVGMPAAKAQALFQGLRMIDADAAADAAALARLVVQLIDELQRRGLGVRRADLIVEKVDGTRQAIRAGTAKTVRPGLWAHSDPKASGRGNGYTVQTKFSNA